jgi:hypothetical protein
MFGGGGGGGAAAAALLQFAAATPSNNNNNGERKQDSVPGAATPAAPRPARRRSIFGGTALLSSSMHGAANNSDDNQVKSVPAEAGAPRPVRRRSIFGSAALLSSSMHGTGGAPKSQDGDERKESSTAVAAAQRTARRRSIFGGVTTTFNWASNHEKEEENNGNSNDAALAPAGDNIDSNQQTKEPAEEDYPFIYILRPASRANDDVDNAQRHPALLPKPAKGRFRNTMKRERSNRKLGSSSRKNKNNSNDDNANSVKDTSSTREVNPRPMDESSTSPPTEKETVTAGVSDDSSIANKVMDGLVPQSLSSLEVPPKPGKGRVRKAILKSLAFRPWKRKLLKDDKDGDDDYPSANGKRRSSMASRRSLHESSKTPDPQLQEEQCPLTEQSPTSTIPVQQHKVMQGEKGDDTKCLDGPSVEEDTVACFNRSFDDLECIVDDGDDGGGLEAASFKEEDIVDNKESFNPLEHFTTDDDCLDAESFDEETVQNEKSVTTFDEYDDEIEEVTVKSEEVTVKSGSIIEYYDEETVVETIVEEFEKSLKSLEYEEEELVDFDQEDVFVLSPNGKVRDRDGKVIGFSENEWGQPSLQPPPLDSETLPFPPLRHCGTESSAEGQEPVLRLDSSPRHGTSLVSNEDDSEAITQEITFDESEPKVQGNPPFVACGRSSTKTDFSTENVNNVDTRANVIVNSGGKSLSPPPSPPCIRNKIESAETLSPEQPLPQTSQPEEHSNEHAPNDEAIPTPSSKYSSYNENFKGLQAPSPKEQSESKSINHMESPMSHTLSEPIKLHRGHHECDDEAPPSPTNKANRFHEIFKGLIMPSPGRERAECLHQDDNCALGTSLLPNLETLRLQSPHLDVPITATQKEAEIKRAPTPARQRKTDTREGSSPPRKKQSDTRIVEKGEESIYRSDPIRWDMRVRFGSPAREVYDKPLRHDDCVLVPDFFGPASDWSIYHKLLVEIEKSSNLIPCTEDVGKHLVCPVPMKSKTFKEVCKKACKYFGIKLETVQFTLNWYRDNTDMQKPRHDEE